MATRRRRGAPAVRSLPRPSPGDGGETPGARIKRWGAPTWPPIPPGARRARRSRALLDDTLGSCGERARGTQHLLGDHPEILGPRRGLARQAVDGEADAVESHLARALNR